MKHYKSVKILPIFRVSSPPRTNPKPPAKTQSPLLKTSGDGSVAPPAPPPPTSGN